MFLWEGSVLISLLTPETESPDLPSPDLNGMYTNPLLYSTHMLSFMSKIGVHPYTSYQKIG